MHGLGFDSVDNFPPQLHYLLHEFRTEVLQIHGFEVLQVFLLGQRSDHRAAVSLLEETLHHLPNPVLLLNIV